MRDAALPFASVLFPTAVAAQPANVAPPFQPRAARQSIGRDRRATRLSLGWCAPTAWTGCDSAAVVANATRGAWERPFSR